MEQRLRARNTATASANRIHDDTVARSLGFRGGLVPGVDVYAYLCRLPARRWGIEWVAHGTMEARFVAPVYDGDEVTVTGTAVEAGEGSTGGPGGRLELTLTDPSGVTCAVGAASCPPSPASRPEPDRWPVLDPPADPPPAGPLALRPGPLGRVSVRFCAEHAGRYLDDVGEDLALFRSGGVAHPAWLLRAANTVLAANVTLGPWIHVHSAARHLGVVRDGEVVETRALVTGEREHKGHRFVDLDVLQLVAGRPVTRIRHTAIYRPRGT